MAASLKLLFVSNLFPDTAQPYRGLDNATLLHRLRESCEVRVISPRPTLPFRWKPPQCRPQDQGLMPHYVPAPYIPKVGSRWNHKLMARAVREPLRRLKAEFGFDVVLCSWLYPDACAMGLLSEESGFPFVAISQGSDAHQYLRIPARRKAITLALERSRGVITRSAELGRLLAAAGVGASKLRTVYNGVDLDLFKPGDRQAARKELSLPLDAPIVLFVGNFYPVKNPMLLVRSHRRLREIIPDCQVLMIGGGDMEKEIREGAAEGVILLGRRSSEEIARYMRAADLLCVPSRNEGVPNVILEAFASGLRVVATRVGGISEVLTNDGLGTLVPSEDESALTTALVEALKRPLDPDRIRKHAMQFSWDAAGAAYLEALRGDTS